MQAIEMLFQIRSLIARAVDGLSEDAFFTIPSGFDNNIAWNLGHIIVTQQALLYRLSGLPLYVSKEQVAMFRTGTSPADWSEKPDIAGLLVQLADHPQKLVEDYHVGKFQTYQPYTTSTGVTLNSFEDAVAFNCFHEGLHSGAILSLKNFLTP
ncbi:MAG: DinB family protein [Anaerolineales bacterium]|nr:DinB family protein [Anaerolineales bacterium]